MHIFIYRNWRINDHLNIQLLLKKLYNIFRHKSTLCCLFLCMTSLVYGQVNLRFEQVGKATYKEDGERTEGTAAPTVTSFDAIIPLSHKMGEDKKLDRAWIGLLNTRFTALHTRNIRLNTSPQEIFNINFGIGHLRRIKENQMILVGVVLTMYSSQVNPMEFRSRNIFYNIAGAHIWEIHPNLQLGAGGVITMFFGYPLPIPFPYVKWKWGDKYMLNVQFISSPEIKLSMCPEKNWTLSLEHSLRGSTAVESIEGVKKMFNHSYRVTAVGASYRYQKIDFYSYLGINHSRKMKFRDRKLKSLFRQNSTNFNPSPYLSVGVKYNFY